METSLSCLNTPLTPKTPRSPILFPNRRLKYQARSWQKGRLRCGLAAECGGEDGSMRTERKSKDEMNGEQGGEEWVGDGEESIEDVKETVELMELEAIMGKDDGKEPMDYNRRAHIFDKSSRVFQAIKESNKQPHHCA